MSTICLDSSFWYCYFTR